MSSRKRHGGRRMRAYGCDLRNSNKVNGEDRNGVEEWEKLGHDEADSIGNISPTHETLFEIRFDLGSILKGYHRIGFRLFTKSWLYPIWLTWFVPISKFQGVKELEELSNRNFESFKESHFGENSVARLLLPKNKKLDVFTGFLVFLGRFSSCVTSQLTPLRWDN